MSATDGSTIYVAGGHASGTDQTRVESYDPSTDMWTTLASLPDDPGGNDGRYGAIMGEIDGKLYLPGGWRTSPPIPSSTFEIYDIATNTWSFGPTMPRLSACSLGGVIDGKLYVLTACIGSGGYYHILDVFDPGTNSWTTKASPTYDHPDGAAAIIDGKLYVAGGYDDTLLYHGKLEIYDPATDTWSFGADMPTARNSVTGAEYNGKLYAMGGSTGGSPFTTVEAYDPTTNTWSTETSLPAARTGMTAVSLDGFLYAIGGHDGSSPVDTVLKFDSVPIVTDAKISISGATGTGGTFKIGDTVTATWDNTVSGDNNPDISTVTVDFTQFGGGAAVAAMNSGEVWTATFTIVAGSIEAANRNVSVTATDDAAQATTTSDTSDAVVDNIAPTVTTVTVNTDPVFEGDLTQLVTVSFSEAMTANGSADPTISFSAGTWSSNGDGAWNMAGTQWTETFTLADNNEVATGVTIDVTAAKDAAGNTQENYVPVAEFDIDTVKPTADIVDVTPDPLTGTNAGVVTINFSEAVTGVGIGDFSLTRTTIASGTTTIDLSGLAVTTITASQYSIDLSTVTTVEGSYELTLNASGSGIKDLAGNDLESDATDDWVLPTSLIDVVDGSVIVTDTGTSTDNQLTVSLGTGDPGGPNAGNDVIIIHDPNGIAVGAAGYQIDNFTIEIPVSLLTGSLTVDAGAGDDTLILDFSAGDPIPAGGLIFNGGAGGNDELIITNFDSAFDAFTANYDNVHDGNLQLKNAGVAMTNITYTGLEPIAIDGSPLEAIFNLPSTNDANVVLSAVDADTMRLSGSTFEDTTFSIAAATSITINANAGNDQVRVSSIASNYAGLLAINGGAGNDTLVGSAFGESFNGESGNDSILAGDGNDTLQGGSGTDFLNGQGGYDCVTETATSYLTLSNTLLLGAGTDKLTSIECAELFGNASGNLLDASRFTIGPVVLHGGDGNDTLVGTSFDDTFDGGAGRDTLRQQATGDQTIVGTTSTATVTGAGSDSLISIDAVHLIGLGRTGQKLDASGFDGSVTLDGGAGNDSLIGGNGYDTLLGGVGNDSLEGNDGNDYLRGQSGNDTLKGGLGDDRLYGDQGRDLILGGDGQDDIDGGLDNDTLDGESGHDTIHGGAGNDAIRGGAGDDNLSGDAGNDTILGNSGGDRIRGGSGSNKIIAGDGDDRIEASGSIIATGLGNDTVVGSGNKIDEAFSFDFDKLLILPT